MRREIYIKQFVTQLCEIHNVYYTWIDKQGRFTRL